MSRTRLGLIGSMGAYLGFTPKGAAPVITGPVRHARSGACESGTALSGLVPYRLHCMIGGVERGMQIRGFSITHTVGQPSTCTFQTTGFPVSVAQEVRITDDGVGQLLFGGTVMQRRRRIQNGMPTIYELQCLDWTWLANKQARVFERFTNVAANVAVRRVLGYCDPALGLRAGSIPSALGTVTLSFVGATVTDAIAEIARAVNALWQITPGKRVTLFQAQPLHGQTLHLHDDTAVKALMVEDFLSQVRTRVWYEGGGSQTTAAVSAGTATLPIAECGAFNADGGLARVETSLFAYAGRSAAAGAGMLTGVAPLAYDAPQGAQVTVFTKTDDSGKQAALATLLGGGLSGVSVFYQADSRLSDAASAGVAQQHLSFYGDPIPQVSATVDDRIPGNRDWQVGRLVDVDVTDPEGETVAGTYRLASVMIRGFSEQFSTPVPTAPRSLRLERDLTLRTGARQGVIDLLVGSA